VKLRAALLAALLLAATPALAAAPRVEGRAYLVENGANGEVLLARHARARLPIASITKLMTALVALQRAGLEEEVTVSARAAASAGASAGLRPGERLTVRELVLAALVASANDAAVALAEHVAGSEAAFAALMNQEARRLGLRDSHFVNATGLDAPGHYSSARDVTALARVAMRYPAIRAAVRARQVTISGGRRLVTWNDLLGALPGVIGVKTGHTSAAGWSEVAAVRGPGLTIYATLIGAPTREGRNADLAELLSFGLAQYRLVPLVRAGRVYARVPAPYGRRPLDLVAARSVVRLARVGRPVQERVLAPSRVRLPVRPGERLGEVQIVRGGRLLVRVPLVAARPMARPGPLQRVGYYARRAVHHVWSWIS
jgi:D-alanyl-D-alanine carboxypeptidase (penicillin-binding protein 5/6)